MNELAQFTYEGEPISFEFTNDTKLINATQMGRPFKGKAVADFLRLKSTKEFIVALESRYHAKDSSTRDVLRIVKGGASDVEQGTWMDELLALKFAGWLSADFEIWMYERIRELLLTGYTSVQGVVPQNNIIQGLKMIVSQLEQQNVFNGEIRHDVDTIRERVNEIEAKVTSVDDHYYTIAGYCSLTKIPCPLHKAKQWGKEATAYSQKKGYDTGAAHDERFGRVRTYHEDILKAIIG